jgi:hypothetical protein
MSDTNIEYQPYLDNNELNRRFVLLEATSPENARIRVEALQDSEKRYQRLFESARDGIVILNADTGNAVFDEQYCSDHLHRPEKYVHVRLHSQGDGLSGCIGRGCKLHPETIYDECSGCQSKQITWGRGSGEKLKAGVTTKLQSVH